MRCTLAAVLGVFFAAGALSAQEPNRAAPPPSGNGEVKGIVVDAKSTSPVARASVSVRNKANNTLVAGALAGTNGAFRVQGLRPGTYSLRLTFIGFAPKLQDITITPAAPVVDVGTIQLSRVAVELSGVEVVEEQAAMVIEPDRNSYKAKDVAPAATNASEVLEATPAVTVDGDGKVSLRGNENVAIQINGRPAPISGQQLGAYLKSLPAGLLDRVEVVPNPSAKHDPEGMAGIINIVLKQNVDLGISAGLTLGAAKQDKYNASGNFGYQVGKLTTFSNLGVFSDDRDVVGINNRERYDALKALTGVTEQDIESNNGFKGENFSTNVDYKLSGRDVLSNTISVNHRESRNNSRNAYAELNGSRALIDEYRRPLSARSRGLSFDYTSALKRTFEARRHELSGEVRLNHSHDEDANSLWREPLAANSASPHLEGQNDRVDAVNKSYTAQLDYVRTMGKTKIETGLKDNGRFLDRDFRVEKDSLGTGTWIPSNLSNAFDFSELVHAAYVVVSRPVGKLELQAGLRGEYADRDFSLRNPSKTYPYSYGSLFPSGVASYNLSQTSQAKISYSRRVRRPGTQELNPFPSFFDVQNVFIGNPELSPEYTDAIELGYNKSGKLGSIQVSPFYRRTTNIIRVSFNTAAVVDGRDVTTVSFKNLAESNSWGTDVNGSFRFGKRLTGFTGLNVFKMVTDGGSSSAVGSDAVSWSARLNGTTELTPTLSLQGFYMYRAPMKLEGGKFSAMQFMNFTLKKKLDGDKSSLSLRASDPFNKAGMRIKIGDSNITQLTQRNFGNRSLYLTYQYNYGQTPRVRQPQQQDQAPASPGGFN